MAALLAACESSVHHSQSFAGLTPVSGSAALSPACNRAGGGTLFVDSEVEPHLAVDPKDETHLIAAWQQDRWSSGGSNAILGAVSFDRGGTWRSFAPGFSHCTGATGADSFERASDPWISFAPDGTAHMAALGLNGSDPKRAILASRSLDSGLTWLPPVALMVEADPDVAVDKETITADPRDATRVYAVWDRLVGLAGKSIASAPIWFSRSSDAGASWEAARMIYDPGPGLFTLGNEIAVLADGTLLDFFSVGATTTTPGPAAVAVIRSNDRGTSWSAPVQISAVQNSGIGDAKTGLNVRTGGVVPSVAADAASGALYVAWGDAQFSKGAREGIAVSRSADGGLTWSAPRQVNGAGQVPAFMPVLAVARDGTVGVTYYDFRADVPSDRSQLLASVWLATSADQGATWSDSPVAGPFDLQNAPVVDGQPQSYFVGDYQGLVRSGAGFLGLFVVANDDNSANRTDVYARPLK
jgi:hypothetical protein